MTTQRTYNVSVDLRLFFTVNAESQDIAEAILMKHVADPRFLMLGLARGVTSGGFDVLSPAQVTR